MTAPVLYLWLVERIGGASVNEYQAFVVSAYTEQEARDLPSVPVGERGWASWDLRPDEVEVTRIGIAEPGMEAGKFILSDYNEG
jgi:hypothetical protein